MTVSRNKKDQLVITLDPRVDPDAVQRLLDKLMFMELAKKAKKVSQKRIDEIADEITAAYWARMKKLLLREGRR